jgi:hypothetical protein
MLYEDEAAPSAGNCPACKVASALSETLCSHGSPSQSKTRAFIAAWATTTLDRLALLHAAGQDVAPDAADVLQEIISSCKQVSTHNN